MVRSRQQSAARETAEGGPARVGNKGKKFMVVREGPPPPATCPVGGRPPGPAGDFAGRGPGREAGALQIHPFPVGVGGKGWRCSKASVKFLECVPL